jgi:hypothetical protein
MAEGEARGATLSAVLAVENLRASWLAVKANEERPEWTRWTWSKAPAPVRALGNHATKLLFGEYKPGAVRAVSIPKANGGER